MDEKISLSHRLFTTDPYNEFAKQHKVKRSVWVKIYHTGYLWRQYSIQELVDYVAIVTKHELKISPKTITRWIKRTDVYNKAQKAIDMGVENVTLEFFQGDEAYIKKQCLKN